MNHHGRTPLHMLPGSPIKRDFKPVSLIWDICRLFLNSGASEILIENLSVLQCCHGPENDIFKFLLQQIYPSFYEFPIIQRLKIIRLVLYSSWNDVSAPVRMALGP